MPDSYVIVVTGSSSGFGRNTVERFADAGWRVYATMRETQGRHADAAAAFAARGMRVVELDVTDQGSVDRAARDILGEAGSVDVLVNNAGATYVGPTEAFTVETVRAQFDLNVFGVLRVNRAFLPAMRERRRGLIVYVSSVTGRLVLPGMGVYCASKAAIEAFAEATFYELKPVGVDVAIVEPGAFATNIGNSRVAFDDSQRAAEYAHLEPTSATILNDILENAQKRDSRDVAEAIYRLATLPAGTRPLRTPVPANLLVERINEAHAASQRELSASWPK
jgi:NAD(P)-dependent dehydrogenase (short-subunit alcohol dehydrogenase family)